MLLNSEIGFGVLSLFFLGVLVQVLRISGDAPGVGVMVIVFRFWSAGLSLLILECWFKSSVVMLAGAGVMVEIFRFWNAA